MTPSFLRCAIASLLVASLAGCEAPGERASTSASDPAACPSGETCSSITPNGLAFEGPSFGDAVFDVDAGPHPIATGGIETIAIHRPGGGDAPSFDAKSTGGIAIAKAAPPVVTVRAMSDGDGYLRIVAPGTDALEDRILLAAKDVDHVDFVPVGEWMSAADRGLGSDRFVYLAGAPVAFAARLFASDGDRLVDETLDVGPSTAVVSHAHAAWDVIEVTAPVGTATASVRTASAATGSLAIEVVDSADDVVLFPFLEDATDRVEVGRAIAVCAGTLHGGKRLVGATYAFDVSGSAHGETGLLAANCIAVVGDAAGSATLSVHAAGASRSFPLAVVAASSAGSPSMQSVRAPRTDALGERASAATSF